MFGNIGMGTTASCTRWGTTSRVHMSAGRVRRQMSGAAYETPQAIMRTWLNAVLGK